MKHLFYIHSHITYIVAASIVTNQNLPHEDVLFFFGRDFSINACPFPSVSLPVQEWRLSNIPSYGEPFLLFREGRFLLRVEKRINEFINNQDFVAYLPLTKNYLMQWIQTHRRCVELNILEEGLLFYTGNSVKPDARIFGDQVAGKFQTILRYPNHLNRSVMFKKGKAQLSKLYTVSESQDWPDSIAEYATTVRPLYKPEVPEEYRLDRAAVFFWDGLPESGVTSIEALRKVFGCFLDHIERQGYPLYIKYHPTSKHVNDFNILIQERNMTSTQIPPEISAEGILLWSTNLTVYGFHSSPIFYASLWGHPSYSLIETLYQIDPVAEERYVRIGVPSIFFDKVLPLRLLQEDNHE